MSNGAMPRRVSVSREELLGIMREVFDAGGVFPFAPLGRSMLPMLREKRDTVVLAGADGREIRRLDVVLYLRDEVGDDGAVERRPVLHRVVALEPGGTFTLCGDRQTTPERGVTRAQVVGVLVEFTRKGRRVDAASRLYRLYAAVWTWLLPARRLASKCASPFRKHKN